MNNLLSKTLIFAAGAAIGSVVTLALVKKHYEQITHDEIDSIRDLYFESKEKAQEESTEGESDDEEDSVKGNPDLVFDREEYESYVKSGKHVKYDPELDEDEDEEEGELFIEPYVISPDDFDEIGYKTVSLYHYDNDVLTDAISGELIEDAEKLVGRHYAEHFGEFEADSVFVRNENIRTDFEILRAGEEYSEDD